MPLSEFPLFSTHTDDTRFTTSRPFTQSALEQKTVDFLGPMTRPFDFIGKFDFIGPIQNVNRRLPPHAETHLDHLPEMRNLP